MNILIVDDQITVLDGIKHGVNFRKLGFENTAFATSGVAARQLLTEQTFHIMLCDIEMPGENGLELNQYVSQAYPEIIRILLTSHAKFSYAQESVKLGCFDYILQPAPFDEIEQCLQRAINKYRLNEKEKEIYKKGCLFENMRLEMSDRIVMNLYSQNQKNINESLSVLDQMGISLRHNSQILIVMLDIFTFARSDDTTYSDFSVRTRFEDSFYDAGFDDSKIFHLLTINSKNCYVMLLFSNDNALNSMNAEWFQVLYENIVENFSCKPAVYVSEPTIFSNIHNAISVLEDTLQNNIIQTPGVYFVNEGGKHTITSPENLTENLSRWKRMANNRDYVGLNKSIQSYLNFIVSIHHVSFKSLCDLHRQLTQLFFNHAYDNDINIADLFDDTYSYGELSDAYKNVDALRTAVKFITNHFEKYAASDVTKNDVESAKSFILNHMADDITVKEVADHVHRSPEYFTKIFKKETGQSIKGYITQVKLDIAKDMLANPNIPISLISAEIGYTNFSHFSQMFKKYENMTPTAYRRKMLEHPEQS